MTGNTGPIFCDFGKSKTVFQHLSLSDDPGSFQVKSVNHGSSLIFMFHTVRNGVTSLSVDVMLMKLGNSVLIN